MTQVCDVLVGKAPATPMSVLKDLRWSVYEEQFYAMYICNKSSADFYKDFWVPISPSPFVFGMFLVRQVNPDAPLVSRGNLISILRGMDRTRILGLTADEGSTLVNENESTQSEAVDAGGEEPYNPGKEELVLMLAVIVDGQPAVGADVVRAFPAPEKSEGEEVWKLEMRDFHTLPVWIGTCEFLRVGHWEVFFLWLYSWTAWELVDFKASLGNVSLCGLYPFSNAQNSLNLSISASRVLPEMIIAEKCHKYWDAIIHIASPTSNVRQFWQSTCGWRTSLQIYWIADSPEH